MKRVLLLLLCFLPLCLHAQFVLTMDGFVNVNNSSKKYLIYEFDNIGKVDLYTSVLKFITSVYISPKDVISKVENEMISVRGVQHDLIGNTATKYTLDYNLIIEIKDNKIRIESPSFICYARTKMNLHLVGSGIGNYVFDKKSGKVVKEFHKKQLEEFFNTLVKKLTKSITSKDD